MEAEKQTEKTAGNPNTEGTTVQTDAPGQEPGMKLFAGDKVLWIIIAALAVISVLVVYSSTAKMAYDAHTAHFLRQQLLILFVCVPLIIIVHKINSRIYNHLALVAYAGSVLLTLAVYFIGATTNGAARWIPLGPFQFQPSEALKVATVLFLARQLAGRQSKIDKIRIVPTWKFWTWRSSPVAGEAPRPAQNLARGHVAHPGPRPALLCSDLPGPHLVGRAGLLRLVGDDAYRTGEDR